jgi:transcription initiation factor IIE alpha subunit
MKTKILIAVLSIGLFSASTLKAQETKQVQIKHEQIGVTYSCPMHADVKSDKPGACPKCGMELKKMEMKTSAIPQCCAGKDHSKMEMKCDSTKMNMNHSEMTHDQMANATYACPMKCEGEKTYDKEGSCPKCNMDLKKMEIKKAKFPKKGNLTN